MYYLQIYVYFIMQKNFIGYVLIDPETEIPRYVGITTRSIKLRFAGHLNDVYNRPNLNKHKTAWFKKLMSKGLLPIIKEVARFDNLEELKLFEQNYISKYKETYKLINQTAGGDFLGFNTHSRESILKSKRTKAVIQYNVLGEKIAEFEIMEDIGRFYNFRSKACSHITQCCKGKRTNAYGYIWKYKDDKSPLPVVDPRNIAFNIIVQYDQSMNRINEFTSYTSASKAIGDGSHGSNIQACCQGLQKTCKGFIFQLEPRYVYFDRNLYLYKIKSSRNIVKKTKTYIRIQQYDLKGNFIKEYSSFNRISIELNIKSCAKRIKECCEGKRKNYRNYIWKYAQVSLNPSNSENELSQSTQS